MPTRTKAGHLAYIKTTPGDNEEEVLERISRERFIRLGTVLGVGAACAHWSPAEEAPATLAKVQAVGTLAAATTVVESPTVETPVAATMVAEVQAVGNPVAGTPVAMPRQAVRLSRASPKLRLAVPSRSRTRGIPLSWFT
jgi:hypothetical protein